MVWAEITLDTFLDYNINDVYENVPDVGFEDEYEKPDDITVEQYFAIIFDQIENKLNNSISMGDKTDLDLTKLIQGGKPAKARSKNFGHQTPKSLIDYLITDIKSMKKSHYGADYKPKPKMVQTGAQTGLELVEHLVKDKALQDYINQQ